MLAVILSTVTDNTRAEVVPLPRRYFCNNLISKGLGKRKQEANAVSLRMLAYFHYFLLAILSNNGRMS